MKIPPDVSSVRNDKKEVLRIKNIQVIDGADNAAYDVFSCTEAEFEELFPAGIDIQFAEDLNEDHFKLLEKVWNRRLEKPDVQGIHGTLFYGLEFKKKYYPNKRNQDLTDASGR